MCTLYHTLPLTPRVLCLSTIHHPSCQHGPPSCLAHKHGTAFSQPVDKLDGGSHWRLPTQWLTFSLRLSMSQPCVLWHEVCRVWWFGQSYLRMCSWCNDSKRLSWGNRGDGWISRFESQETSHPSCTVTSVQAEVSSLTSLSLFHLENGGCELYPLYSTGPTDCFRDN